MKTNINLTTTYTFDQFLSKEFVLFLKEEIKSIVADQKIAKRDRKGVFDCASNNNNPGSHEMINLMMNR